MQVSEEVLNKIKREIEEVDYGSVEIVINKDKPYVDIMRHERKRAETVRAFRTEQA
jgi:hypothetical protein